MEPETIEMSTREVIARLDEELMGLGHALSTIGLVYEPVPEREPTYRDAGVVSEAPLPGFRRLGRMREKTLSAESVKELWIDADGVTQFEVADPSYHLITYFTDGSAVMTSPSFVGPAKTFGRLTRRNGTGDGLAVYAQHAEAVRVQVIVNEARALYVADIEVACVLGRYFHRHLA